MAGRKHSATCDANRCGRCRLSSSNCDGSGQRGPDVLVEHHRGRRLCTSTGAGRGATATTGIDSVIGPPPPRARGPRTRPRTRPRRRVRARARAEAAVMVGSARTAPPSRGGARRAPSPLRGRRGRRAGRGWTGLEARMCMAIGRMRRRSPQRARSPFAGFLAGRADAFLRAGRRAPCGRLRRLRRLRRRLRRLRRLLRRRSARRGGLPWRRRRRRGRAQRRARCLAALTTSAEGFGIVGLAFAAGRRGRPLATCPSCEPKRLRLVSSSASRSKIHSASCARPRERYSKCRTQTFSSSWYADQQSSRSSSVSCTPRSRMLRRTDAPNGSHDSPKRGLS